ncbi:hypothetical protein Glove_139g380 [Diversispora epigaea]|uniref:Uncharacterized protein n=1 Tax=Diversispora epigaea TaxID=1348612 RepID=A0A397IYI1_9GLOM|nr:hypothetical protein Glove_139g380 [Diversispora epigaea]
MSFSNGWLESFKNYFKIKSSIKREETDRSLATRQLEGTKKVKKINHCKISTDDEDIIEMEKKNMRENDEINEYDDTIERSKITCNEATNMMN